MTPEQATALIEAINDLSVVIFMVGLGIAAVLYGKLK